MGHYRAHTQQEVDFVLEDATGRLVGIEVTRKRFVRGILLYPGSATVAFGPNLQGAIAFAARYPVSPRRRWRRAPGL